VPELAATDGPDPLLWTWGLRLADHHQPDPADETKCRNGRCAGEPAYPCRLRRTA